MVDIFVNKNKMKLSILGGRKVVSKNNSFLKDRASLRKTSIQHILSTFESGAWSMFTSTEVSDFEKKFAKYVGAKESVLVNSCTNAIYASILATKPKNNANILVPAYTYIGTCLPILASGCKAVFADIDETSQSISYEHFCKIIEKENIHAVIQPHLFGKVNFINAKKIIKLCKEKNIWYIADCAQFIGVKRITSYFSEHGLCCFSFGESKLLRIGEGGAVISNSKFLMESVRMVRHEGEKWKNNNNSRITNWQPSPHNIIYDLESTTVGLNFRPLSFVATLAKEQLKYLKEELYKTEHNSTFLLDHLSQFSFIKLPQRGNRIWWTFPIILEHKSFTRDEILAILLMEGIPAGVHFPKLIFNHDIFQKDLKIKELDYPNSYKFSNCHIVLPIYPLLNTIHMKMIVSAFRKINEIMPRNIPEIKQLAQKCNR
jgi:perosamine synthetase